MDLIIILTSIFILGILIFLIFEYPYIILSIVLFMFLYDYSVETGLPIDPRGILLIIIFIRLIFDSENFTLILKYLLPNIFFYIIVAFLLISFFITLFYYFKLIIQIRFFILLLISTLLGFVTTTNEKGKNVFVYAIILSALIAASDIIFSFMFTHSSSSETIRITRVLNILPLPFKTTAPANYNYYAIISGIGFIYTYLFYKRRKIPRIISYILMIFLGIGVVFSTSRSSLLAVIIVFIIVSVLQKEIIFNFKKIINTAIICIFMFISFYFLYNALLQSKSVDKTALDSIYFRLYVEPFDFLGGDKKVFNKFGDTRGSTISWRYTRITKDIQRYMKLGWDKKLFGLGVGGYMRTNFSYQKLNPHNGYVLLLIERGALGLLIFLIFSIGLIIKSIKLTRIHFIHTPVLYAFMLLMIYSIGQNAELTQPLSFLFLGGMIGNLSNLEKAEEIESELTDSSSPEVILHQSFSK